MTTDGSTQLRLPRGRRPVPTRTSLRTRPVSVALYAGLLILLPALVVVGGMAGGWWSTAGHGEGGGAVSRSLTGDAPAAIAAPADVRGSMTVRQVVDAFASVTPARPVTAVEIVAAFGAPAGTPDTAQLKALVTEGSDSGMDLPAFRTWLQQRLAPE